MSSLASLSVLLFDFDDTLMATRDRRIPALIRAAADFGYRVTEQDIAKHWGKPFRLLISGIVPNVTYEVFHRHYSAIMRGIPPRVLPGARDVLALLHDRGVTVFVMSSGSNALVRQDLEDGKLWQYISMLWGYEDTPYHKPDPRALQPVIETLAERGIPTDRLAYIGDGLADFHVAVANKVLFCAVLSGNDTRKDFRSVGLGNDLIVDSLEELLGADSWLQRTLE